jgi:hypothetical protein
MSVLYPNDTRGRAEGWKFSTRPRFAGDERVVIKKYYGNKKDRDAKRPFATDEDAVAFVMERAASGSGYHQECLAYALAQRLKY